MEKLTALDMLRDDYNPYDNTVDDLLERWDAGNSVWSIEMGGIGPGYEQAIQILAVEFARAGRSMPRTDDDEADYKTFDVICTDTLKTLGEDLQGITGAQFGAAKWLAWQWCFGGGPQALLDRLPGGEEDRKIQVSRDWPRAAAVA